MKNILKAIRKWYRKTQYWTAKECLKHGVKHFGNTCGECQRDELRYQRMVSGMQKHDMV